MQPGTIAELNQIKLELARIQKFILMNNIN